MKKFTLVSLVAAAAFATTAAFSASNVFAADGDTTGTTPAATTDSTKSSAKIELGDETGTDGKTPLGVTLDATPSFDFGKQTISTTKQDYTISEQTAKGAAVTGNLTVTNHGTAQAWYVSVQGSQFATTDGTILKGATLAVPAGEVTKGASDNLSDPANGTAISLDLSQGAASSSDVFSATAGNGVGTWLDTFKDATLHVPAGNVSGTYTSSLTWTLADTPATK